MIKINHKDIRDRSQCCGCSACANVCPKECILMKEDEEGFLYPVVNAENCISCDLCEKVCPIIISNNIDALQANGKQTPQGKCRTNDSPKAFAVINKDEEIRLQSSSGGMFTLLAEHVLEKGGVVFGAVMSDDCKSVYHIGVNTKEELSRLRGSKYLQSRIGNTYQQVKELLNEDRGVLFSGTPCQIEGLLSYLGQEYEKLLCVDFCCHGVPSPKVWEFYVDDRLRRTDATSVRQTLFRYKINGWKEFAVLFEYSNNTTYVGNLYEDLYMKAFLNDACLRPSCYACKFKKLNRNGDITLADFWGVESVMPEMDDDKGTSLVIIHSNKGEKIFEDLSSNVIYKEVDVNEAVKYNPAMIYSVKMYEQRKDFLCNLENMPFDKLVKKYAKKKQSWKQRVSSGLRKIGFYEVVLKIYHKLKLAKRY